MMFINTHSQTYLDDLTVEIFGVVGVFHEEDELVFAFSVLVQLDHIVVIELRVHHALLVREVDAQIVLQFLLEDLLLYDLLYKETQASRFSKFGDAYSLRGGSNSILSVSVTSVVTNKLT